MISELTQWPAKLEQGRVLAEDLVSTHSFVLAPYSKIAFVGMGGSGIAGRICKTLLERYSDIPVLLVDSPAVPHSVDANTLTFVISYSGNTWETLDAFATLVKREVPLVTFSHGGRLEQSACRLHVPHVQLPLSLQPRTALGVFLGLFVTLFCKRGVRQLASVVADWESIARQMMPHCVEEGWFKPALDFLQGREFFHIWGVSDDAGMAAYRGATQFNENAKVQAVFGAFPELAHNLLVGLEQFTVRPGVLWYQTSFQSENMKNGIQALHDMLHTAGVDLYKVPVFGDTFESQFFSTIIWTDFASFYLAKARGVNAERVRIIEELKQRQQSSGILVEV